MSYLLTADTNDQHAGQSSTQYTEAINHAQVLALKSKMKRRNLSSVQSNYIQNHLSQQSSKQHKYITVSHTKNNKSIQGYYTARDQEKKTQLSTFQVLLTLDLKNEGILEQTIQNMIKQGSYTQSLKRGNISMSGSNNYYEFNSQSINTVIANKLTKQIQKTQQTETLLDEQKRLNIQTEIEVTKLRKQNQDLNKRLLASQNKESQLQEHLNLLKQYIDQLECQGAEQAEEVMGVARTVSDIQQLFGRHTEEGDDYNTQEIQDSYNSQNLSQKLQDIQVTQEEDQDDIHNTDDLGGYQDQDKEMMSQVDLLSQRTKKVEEQLKREIELLRSNDRHILSSNSSSFASSRVLQQKVLNRCPASQKLLGLHSPLIQRKEQKHQNLREQSEEGECMYTLQEPSHEDTQSNDDIIVISADNQVVNSRVETDEGNVNYDTFENEVPIEKPKSDQQSLFDHNHIRINSQYNYVPQCEDEDMDPQEDLEDVAPLMSSRRLEKNVIRCLTLSARNNQKRQNYFSNSKTSQ